MAKKELPKFFSEPNDKPLTANQSNHDVPSYGHLKAVFCIKHGLVIPQDVIDFSITHASADTKDDVRNSITRWNQGINDQKVDEELLSRFGEAILPSVSLVLMASFGMKYAKEVGRRVNLLNLELAQIEAQAFLATCT